MPKPQLETPRFTRRVWLVVAIVTLMLLAIGALSILLQSFLVLFAGVLFGVFLNQFSRHVARLSGMKYGAALALVVLLLLSVLGGTIYFMGSQISQQASEFSQQFREAADQVQSRLQEQGWLQWLGGQSQQQGQMIDPSQAISTARSAAVTLFSLLGGMVLVFFLGFYFALQPDHYRHGLLKLVPQQARPRVADVLDQLTKTLWWWTLGRLVGMAIIGAGSTAGLWFIGIPLPVTLGVIAGLSNFVPNLGPLVSSVPPILFGLQQGPETALYVAGFYLLLQLVESYFITPLIDQHQVSLPPGLVLAMQLLMGALAGVLGLLLATPLTAVAYVLVREFYVRDMLGDRD